MPEESAPLTGAEQLAEWVEKSRTLNDLRRYLAKNDDITVELADGQTGTDFLLGPIDNLIDAATRGVSCEEANNRGMFNSLPTPDDHQYPFDKMIADLYRNTRNDDR